MQLTNARVREMAEALTILGHRETSDVLLAFQIGALTAWLEPLSAPIEKAERQLVEKHAEMDERNRPRRDENQQIVWKDKEEADAELSRLLDAEVELPEPPVRLSVRDFLRGGMRVNGATVAALGPLLDMSNLNDGAQT